MSAVLWFGVLVGGLLVLAAIYFCLIIAVKAFITLLPAFLIILTGIIFAFAVGGILGAVGLLASIFGAFIAHDRWEGTELYARIEAYFERKT